MAAKRNRRAGVADRWTKTVRDAAGNAQTVPSARNGKGMRWLARYVDDEGREHTKAFTRKADAQSWLDNDVIARLATGTYVAPEAGKVTVAAVYASWSAAQGHISAKTAATRRSAWKSRVELAVGRRGCHRREDVGDSRMGVEDGSRRRRRSDDRECFRAVAPGPRRGR